MGEANGDLRPVMYHTEYSLPLFILIITLLGTLYSDPYLSEGEIRK